MTARIFRLSAACFLSLAMPAVASENLFTW